VNTRNLRKGRSYRKIERGSGTLFLVKEMGTGLELYVGGGISLGGFSDGKGVKERGSPQRESLKYIIKSREAPGKRPEKKDKTGGGKEQTPISTCP